MFVLDMSCQNLVDKCKLEDFYVPCGHRVGECIFENYLTMLKTSDSISLAKFRCGNHKLPISNRYQNDTTHSLCPLCNTGEIGDEMHYILTCSALKYERKKYVKSHFYKRPNIIKFDKLFNSKNVSELTNLAKFTKLIMTMFN